MNSAPVAAALAGLQVGMQAQGAWIGRRQVFVRFANEAETATLFTADGLAGELKRILQKSVFHSISLCGRDVLANADYIAAAFANWAPAVPVLLDSDGQRPDMLPRIGKSVSLMQVSLDFAGPEAIVDRGMQTIEGAARLNYQHVLVLCPREDTSDGQILRVVERAHSASTGVAVILHPYVPGGTGDALERRWASLLERMQLLHDDVRVMLRLAPPAGMR